jgi:hypothetical protein
MPGGDAFKCNLDQSRAVVGPELRVEDCNKSKLWARSVVLSISRLVNHERLTRLSS